MTDEEFYEMQDFLFGGVHCEWDNRQRCDSLYIEKYNKLAERVHKAIKYMEEENKCNLIAMMGTYYYKLLEILKDNEE